MRTILARHLTGDDVEREIEVRNAAKLGEWRPGKLEAVTQYANKTVLSIYWDDEGKVDEWTIRKTDACVHVRVPDFPARFVASSRGHGKRNAALSELEARASVLGPCPECLVAAGEPCVGLPGETAGLLGRIHGERIHEEIQLDALRKAAMLEGKIL